MKLIEPSAVTLAYNYNFQLWSGPLPICFLLLHKLHSNFKPLHGCLPVPDSPLVLLLLWHCGVHLPPSRLLLEHTHVERVPWCLCLSLLSSLFQLVLTHLPAFLLLCPPSWVIHASQEAASFIRRPPALCNPLHFLSLPMSKGEVGEYQFNAKQAEIWNVWKLLPAQSVLLWPLDVD